MTARWTGCEWTEEERDSLCDALSKYTTKRRLSNEARVDIVIRAVDRIMAARYEVSHNDAALRLAQLRTAAWTQT